jgi:UDP-glucose/iron transport system permease protein
MNEGGIVDLSLFDLALSTVLVLVAGITSLLLRLGLERRLLIAAVRAISQLMLVGYILTFIFKLNNALLVLGILLIMIAVAGYEAVRRSQRTFAGATLMSFGVLVVSGLVTTFTVTGVVIGVEPWFRPQYVIPLAGMILGNGLTGISLCLGQLLDGLVEKRELIEMELAHGATCWEAGRDVVRDAVSRGLIPIINSMMVVGLVALPGMMTGQIIAGADPLVAVKYQVVVMFMIAAATSMACIMMALLIHRRMFNNKHQLVTGVIRGR